jgi:hypothetical protein
MIIRGTVILKAGFSIFILFLLLKTVPVKAQSNNLGQDNSYLTVTSNFDSLYVLTGQDSSLVKVSSNELINVGATEQQIILIPEFAPTISFNNNFQADSFYVVDVQFGLILDQINPDFQRIQSGDNNTDKISPSSIGIGFIDINVYNEEGYNNRSKLPEIDYKNTYLKVISNTDSVYVRTSDAENSIVNIASGDSILYKPGDRIISISHPYSKEWRTRRVLKGGETTKIEHEFDLMEPSIESLSDNLATKPHYRSNVIIVSDNDSEIIVNGEFFGTGAVNLNYPTGPVDVLIDNPSTGQKRFSGKVTNLPSEKAIIIDAYTKPVKLYSQIYGVLPGVSQWYKQQKLKSALFSGGFIALGGITLQRNSQYNQELTEFDRIQDLYSRATTEERALELGDQLEAQQAVTKQIDNQRRIFLGLTSLLYLYNLYDALFDVPDSGFRDKTDFEFYFQQNSFSDQPFTSMTVKYAF